MGCLFERDDDDKLVKVMAPGTRRRSLLFEQIKQNIPDDYEPDAFVQTAFKEGKIKSLTSKDEVALALWAKVHTPSQEVPGMKHQVSAVKEGYVRLYRGETDGMELGLQHASKGHFFTTSLSEARDYNEEYGAGDGRISYIDVPEGEVEQYRASNGKVTEGMPEGLQQGFILPEGLTAQRMPYTDAPELKDLNGEPIFPVLRQWLGLGSNLNVSKKIGLGALIRFLLKEQLIYKDGNRYLLSKEPTLQYGGKNPQAQNAKRIESMLEQFGLNAEAVRMEKKGKEMVVSFDANQMKVDPKLSQASRKEGGEMTHTKRLVRFLKERFPQLNIEFTTVDKARAIYRQLQMMQPPGRRYKIDFERVKSFVYKGKVYLIEGRVDNEVVVEEVLHPFVYTVSKENPALFKELLAAAKKEFPEVHKEIEGLYGDKAGFTQGDRDEELVAQVLSKLFHKEYTTKPPASIRSLLNQFLEWFAKLVSDFGAFIGGKNQVVINTSQLKEGMGLTDIARMLNTFDSQFLVDTTSPAINFRQVPGWQKFMDTVTEQANDLQKEVIKDVYHPKNPVRLVENDHTYLDRLGNIFRSVTTAINGKFNDPDGKYELNRLFGNALDLILDSLVRDMDYEQVEEELQKKKLKVLDDKTAESAYRELRAFLQGLRADGSIILPQVAVSDGEDIAGTIDLLQVHPNGTMTVIDLKTSKHSVKDTGYWDHRIEAGEGSMLEGEPLSKAQRHGIQIGCYKRMLEVAGHTVVATKTYHIWLHIDGEGKEQKVKKFQMQDFVVHEPSENEGYVRRIIKAEPTEDRLAELRRGPGFDGSRGGPDERTKGGKAYLDLFDQLRVKMEGFRDKLADRVDRMERIKSVANFNQAREAKQKLSELLMFISDDLSKGKANQAYGRFLRYAKEELEQLNAFIADPTKKGTDEYIERVLDVDNYLATYRGLVNAPKWALGDYDQERLFNTVLNLLDTTQKEVKGALEDYVLRMAKLVSKKKDLTEEDWKAILKQGVDISKADKYLGDIDTSTDALVAVAAKIYKFAKLKAMARSERFETKLRAVTERVAKAFGGQPDYDMMLDYDENGMFTGRYVQQIGIQFWRIYKAAKAKVTDSEGRMLKYRPVYSPANAKPEDLEFNKRLYKAKKEWYKFIEAENTEVLDAKGLPTKGKYYEYKKEFTDERAKNEEFKDGRWVRKAGVTWKQYKLYEMKYYDTLEGYDTPFLHGGKEFRGVMNKNTGSKMRIVKDAYRQVRERAGDGTDMRSQKYVQLMTGTDERTKAMRDFYEFFVESMGEALDMLPASIRRDMLGKVGRVRGKLIERSKRSPAFLKAVFQSAGDWLKVRTSTRQAMYNEDGTLVNQIPVFYTGNFRSERLIEGLENKIKALDADLAAKKISKADYVDQHKKLKDDLDRAENALDPSQVEVKKLHENLKLFWDMAANFDEMQRIEGSILAVDQMLENREYTRKTASGKEVTDKDGNIVRFKGQDARTVARYKAWLRMVFYSSEELDRGTWEVVAKRLMNVSSFVNVGVNAFGPIHNYAAGRINTAIEVWGGLFYDRSAARRAIRTWRNEFLPGFVRNFSAMEGDYYKKKRLGSKFEALVVHYHMIRHTRLGEGKPKKSVLDNITYGYWGQSAGEFAVQSMSGMAYLMSQMVTSEDGKTTLSLYDAYEFDEKSQTLKFKKGFEYLEKDETRRFDVTNTIWEINKQIHGNYAWEDRAMIQEEILGQMAMQFHKWVYPAYKSRFGAYYYDENLGHIEGRYRTILHLILLYKKAEGTFTERANAAFKGMRPDQVKNMYRNAAELSYFFLCMAAYGLMKSLADGFGDDDKYQKRLINFLAWEASRERKEIQFWFPGLGAPEQFEMIKNPFASGTTVTQFSDVLWELVKLPIPPYDDAYYTRGPFKGDLKLGKEFRDLIPVMKELNRWATFDNVTSFHIK